MTRPSLAIGFGCTRGAPASLLLHGIARTLADHALDLRDVRGLATLDTKRDEPSLGAVSARFGLPITFFSAAELAAVTGLARPSERVAQEVGTRGVAEPAALRLGRGPLIVPKTRYSAPMSDAHATVAVARYERRDG